MSESVPPGLAPWLTELEVLAPALRPPLASCARALDALVGPVRSRAQPAGGQPDGYDGLDRRGPFDRLLLSDLSLLELAPDEFLRRVGTGELGYLRLELREPRRGRRIVALLDAGPDQLGMPRLVQLAALFVLSRRARLAGATLEWRLAQRPDVRGHGVSRDELAAFLAAASLADLDLDAAPGRAGSAEPAANAGPGAATGAKPGAATGAKPTATADTKPAAPAPPEPDERWIIGPAPQPGVRATHWLELVDVAGPDGDHVDVTLHRPGREVRRIRLPHLHPAAQSELFLAPFGRRAAAPSSSRKVAAWGPLPEGLGEARAVRFLPGTRQLAVLFGERDVLLWSVSKAETAGVPKARHKRSPGGEVVAVGYRRQRARHITLAEGGLRADGSEPRPFEAGVAPPPGGLGFVLPDDTGRFLTADGDLWGERRGRMRPLGPKVLAVGGSVSHLYLLLEEPRPDGAPVVRLHLVEPGGLRPVGGTASGGLGAAFYGEVGTCLVAHPDHVDCLLPWMADTTRYPLGGPAPAPGSGVLGVRFTNARPGTPPQEWRYAPIWVPPPGALVHRGDDQLPIPLPRAPTAAAVDPFGRLLALISVEGTVELWSLETGEALMLRSW